MVKARYPQYEWHEDLKRGLEALSGSDANPESKRELLSRAKESYDVVRDFYETAVNIVRLIENNPRFEKFSNTSIYHCSKRGVVLFKEILEKYKRIQVSS